MTRFHATSEGNIPFTKEEETACDAEEAAYAAEQIELAKVAYKQLRASAYPPIGDQLDALFHAGVFPVEMADLIQAVKNQHPKPN